MSDLLGVLRAAAPAYSPRARGYVHVPSGTLLHGLISVLQTTFYEPTVRARRRYTGNSSSRARGIGVDEQLGAWVETRAPPKDKFAINILSELERCGLSLIATQIPVSDPASALVAIVDGLAVDAAGRPCLVEWKTGHDWAYTRASGRMRHVLTDVPNSLRHRHGLQVYAAALMVARATGRSPPACVVVVANARGTRAWEVGRDIERAGDAILRHVERQQARTRAAPG